MRVDHCINSPGVVYDSSTGISKQIPCGKCPYCLQIKRWRLRKDIDYGVEGLYRLDGYMTFFTLTTSFESNRSDLMTYWKRYRAFLAYYGYKQDYVIIPEYKGGLAHIHGIGNRFIPHNLMMAAWWSATGKTAWKVDVQKLNMSKSASGYLVKYITKAIPDQAPRVKRARRVMFSQGWPRRPKTAKGSGNYVMMSYDEFRHVQDPRDLPDPKDQGDSSPR